MSWCGCPFPLLMKKEFSMIPTMHFPRRYSKVSYIISFQSLRESTARMAINNLIKSNEICNISFQSPWFCLPDQWRRYNFHEVGGRKLDIEILIPKQSCGQRRRQKIFQGGANFFFFSKVFKFTWWKMQNQFTDIYFSSYGHFCTQDMVNFRRIFTHNLKNKNWENLIFDFSSDSAHSASIM